MVAGNRSRKLLDHGLAGLDRRPEVAAEHRLEVLQVLHEDRLVEAVALRDRLDPLAGVARSPSRARAGSPGRDRTQTNSRSVRPRSTGTMRATRLSTNRSTAILLQVRHTPARPRVSPSEADPRTGQANLSPRS